jgi:hypothetical protein
MAYFTLHFVNPFKCAFRGRTECLTPDSFSSCCKCKHPGCHLNLTCFLSSDWYCAAFASQSVHCNVVEILWYIILKKCRCVLKHEHMLGHAGTFGVVDELKVQFITLKTAV